MFPCNLCNKEYSSKLGLKSHQNRIHIEKGKVDCTDCGKQFKFRQSLYVHIKSVHEKLKAACEYCDKVFSKPSHKKRHIKSAHEKARFPCSMCDYEATYQDNLRTHQ